MIIEGIEDPEDKDFIITYTGKRFHPLEPRWEDIDILDIAHQLAAINRFSGSTRRPYSVAQHSYFVSFLSNEHPLQGLLHDGSEAYLGDVPSPLKRHAIYTGYRQAETVLQNMIYEKYGVRPGDKFEDVRLADCTMCVVEGCNLMPMVDGSYWTKHRKEVHESLTAWPADLAEEMFLRRFESLTKENVLRVAF